MSRRAGAVVALLALAVAAFLWGRLLWPEPEPQAPVTAPGAAALTVEAQPADEPAEPQEIVTEALTPEGDTLRLIRHAPLRRPDPPFGPAYRELLPKAEAGDAASQYRLGLLLYDCRDVAESPAEAKRQVAQMEATRKRGGFEVEDPQSEAAEMQRRQTACEGVPQAARGGYRDWLKRAAGEGLVEAQMDLLFHLPQAEYCQFLWECTPAQREQLAALQAESLQYATQARDAGSAAALWTIGAWYMNEEVLPRNDIEAYAHFLALDRIHAASGQGQRFNAILADLHKRLRPIDLQQAESRAQELLANPKCCVLEP